MSARDAGALATAPLEVLDACLDETSARLEIPADVASAAVVATFPDVEPRLRGHYRPGNLYVGGATCRPRKYAARSGYQPIPVVSLGPAPWKALSPFFLGPVGGAANVENYWQFHKVWQRVERQRQIKRPKNAPPRRIWVWPSETHADAAGNVRPAYWAWRAAGFANAEAVRRPNGRHIPLYSLFRGQQLGLAAARKQIYVPAYQSAASKTLEFARLLAKLRAGEKLLLLDFDGPKLDLHPGGVPAEARTLAAWAAKAHDAKGRYFPYGHGYVLARLLLAHLGAGAEEPGTLPT